MECRNTKNEFTYPCLLVRAEAATALVVCGASRLQGPIPVGFVLLDILRCEPPVHNHLPTVGIRLAPPRNLLHVTKSLRYKTSKLKLLNDKVFNFFIYLKELFPGQRPLSCPCLGDFLTKSLGMVLDDANEALLVVHVGNAFPSTFHQVLLRHHLISLFTLEKFLQTNTMY